MVTAALPARKRRIYPETREALIQEIDELDMVCARLIASRDAADNRAEEEQRKRLHANALVDRYAHENDTLADKLIFHRVASTVLFGILAMITVVGLLP